MPLKFEAFLTNKLHPNGYDLGLGLTAYLAPDLPNVPDGALPHHLAPVQDGLWPRIQARLLPQK